MHIVHLSIGSLPPVFSKFGGAIQRRVAELAQEQTRRGHDVTVISPGDVDAEDQIDDVRVRYLRLRVPPPGSHLEFQARALASIARGRSRSMVVHIHSEPEAAALAAPLRVPCLLTYDYFLFRGTLGKRLAPLYRAAMGRFKLLLPCSEHCRDASAAYWGLSPDRMRVVPNGVDPQVFRPDAASGAAERTRLGIGGPMIVYIGRVCRQKGTDTLLDAFDLVQRARPDARLVIAGPLEQFDADHAVTEDWESRMRAAGVLYLGVVPDQRLPALYNAADVFVMPTAELEMFGMAAVEAQACGTVVVASDHGGLRETVPLDCGLRFPPGDAAGLAEAVVRLLNDAPELEARGARARRYVARYAWARVADELEEVYGSVCSNGR